MYFMYKDHKNEGGWRPVVSGCNSNTLGLSNVLSDLVESVCESMKNLYEVLSSEDMLSRIEDFNKKIEEEKKRRGDDAWDWRQEWTLIGSDVVSLFPSLTAENTSKCVRRQATKSDIEWTNIDEDWLRLYIHMNIQFSSDISQIEHLLPKKRQGKRGVEPGMNSTEVKKRDLNKSKDSSWSWPEKKLTKKDIHLMMAIMLEIAVKQFFKSFVYINLRYT